MKPQPAIFEEHEIRRVYDEATETWLFSVIDIVQVLTQQPDYQTARKYWNKLKERLGKEGSESALARARETWQKHGRSEKWIQQRMTGQETRNKLTDYWAQHDVKKGEEYAILTNIIHQEWAEVSVKAHKEMKSLQTHNLRDHMSEAELIFTALAELSTRQIAESVDATGMAENEAAAKTGGGIAKNARRELEAKTGKKVVSGESYLPPSKRKGIEK